MRMLMIIAMALVLATTASAQQDVVHVPVPDGWSAVDEEYRYGRDDLWEYINGAADLFLSYGFRELIVRDLEQGDRYVTISVYDMGGPLDAFGVYERERPDDEPEITDVGAAAVLQPPYRGLMLKDRFYVKAEIAGGDVSAGSLASLLGDVAAGLPGRDGLPPQLAELPDEGRQSGTVAFAGRAFLGLEDLSSCVHATYALADGTEYRLFTLRPGRALLSDTARWNRQERPDGRQLIWREIPYSGVVALLGDEDSMLGVADLADLDRAVEILTAAAP
ncbi:hypothetical protein GF314_10425 [bacterium]|nr:hypothetical protein [bacterium]